MNRTRTLVGTYTIPEAIVRDDRGYECALWWRQFNVLPGTYPVYTDGYWFLVKADATIVADFFPARIGAAIAPYDTTQNAGKADTFGYQWTEYDAGKLVAEGNITLNPEWVLVQCGTYSERCGELAGTPIYAIRRASKAAA